MNRQFLPLRRVVLFLGAVACYFSAAHALAQDSGASVVRVEEDWELYVGQPDSNSAGPQVSVAFSPTGDLSGLYAVFELNHQSLPDFVAGGLQLQIWNGDTPDASRKYPNANLLSTVDECVQWTQSMEMQGSTITFEIEQGTSTTWGTFGGQGYMRHSQQTSVPNLNGYSPAVSVANSGAGFASNRVRLLLLRSVRYELSNGQVVEDNTVRVAYPTESTAQ